MQGARRVVTFCLLIAVLPVILLIIPLYLRHSVYQDVIYELADSEILEIVNGISSFFCQEHSLQMNSSFNAFQVKGLPSEIVLSNEAGSLNRSFPSVEKHVRLKKSMSLEDDTLEYWGFFLPAGSTVLLSVCSRFAGPRLLVVKGERSLRKCGFLEPAKTGGAMAEGQGKVSVKFESPSDQKSEKMVEDYEEQEYEGEITDDPVVQKLDKNLKLVTESTVFSSFISNEQLLSFNTSAINKTHRHRHDKSRHRSLLKQTNNDQEVLEQRKKNLAKELNLNRSSQLGIANDTVRKKRHTEAVLSQKFDDEYAHGEKKLNVTSKRGNDSSISSFENSLLTCYDGQILLAQAFFPSKHCNGTAYLENGKHMEVVHNVGSDGYYYYIFYSDNDDVQNDIHAIFNIHKPTYHYYSISCINKTECNFPISFMSDEIVIVEVPIRDGIRKQENNTRVLMSRCHPRSAIYAIFPISVLLLILVCSFL